MVCNGAGDDFANIRYLCLNWIMRYTPMCITVAGGIRLYIKIVYTRIVVSLLYKYNIRNFIRSVYRPV